MAARGRFLTDTDHDHEFVSACPVGANGICAGRTGRPASHPTFGSNGPLPGSNSHGNAAASLPRLERPQGGLPISGSSGVWPVRDSAGPSATDAGSVSATRGVFADRRHHRTGLFEPSPDRAVGLYRQRAGPWIIAAQHPGSASGGLEFGPGARRGSAGTAGAQELDSPSEEIATPTVAATHGAAAGIGSLGQGVGPTGLACARLPMDLFGGSGSRFL